MQSAQWRCEQIVWLTVAGAAPEWGRYGPSPDFPFHLMILEIIEAPEAVQKLKKLMKEIHQIIRRVAALSPSEASASY